MDTNDELIRDNGTDLERKNKASGRTGNIAESKQQQVPLVIMS